MLSDKEILFATLLGSKIVDSIPRFSLVQNELMKHPAPQVPFFPFKNTDKIEYLNGGFDPVNLWSATPKNEDKQFFPLIFRKRVDSPVSQEPWFTLPYEVLISVSGKNDIVKRKVAKAKNFIGTIKEHWSQDDYEITITGVLFGSLETGSVQDCYPRSDFEKLRMYCTSPLGLEVKCPLLEMLGINNIVVEDFTFPFSKGENVQAYEMKALSDYSSEFLLELE